MASVRESDSENKSLLFAGQNAYFLMRFSSTLTPPKRLTKTEFQIASVDRWKMVKMEAFENGVEESVIYCRFHQRFERFYSVDDLRKRIKKYPFWYENGTVWTGENKTKGKIFCFVFVEKNTDPFKKTLVWSRPQIKAKFRRLASHEPNQMLMRENKGFFSFAFGSAHVHEVRRLNLTLVFSIQSSL